MLEFSISKTAQSIQHEWLTALGVILDNPIIFSIIVIAIGLLFERQKDGRLRLAASLLLTFMLAIALKSMLAVERPCVSGVGLCPTSYSLPSLHTAISFTLMFAFLRKPIFPWIMLLAIFVAFTRLNLGVHTFEDVAAALPIAFISFFLISNLWRRWSP